MDERDTMGIGNPAEQVAEAERLRRATEPDRPQKDVKDKDPRDQTIRTDRYLGETVFFIWERFLGDVKVSLPLRGKVVEIIARIAEKRGSAGDEYLIHCPALKTIRQVPNGRVYSGALQAIECATVENDHLLKPAPGVLDVQAIVEAVEEEA